jgi:hypothetical protein
LENKCYQERKIRLHNITIEENLMYYLRPDYLIKRAGSSLNEVYTTFTGNYSTRIDHQRNTNKRKILNVSNTGHISDIQEYAYTKK